MTSQTSKPRGRRQTTAHKRSLAAKTSGIGADAERVWNLRLYVAGQTPRSTAAVANLKKICEEHLAGRYRIEIIDLMKSPQLARDHQILAVPTLVRELPAPLKKVIGDLSNTERALVGLELRRDV